MTADIDDRIYLMVNITFQRKNGSHFKVTAADFKLISLYGEHISVLQAHQ